MLGLAGSKMRTKRDVEDSILKTAASCRAVFLRNWKSDTLLGMLACNQSALFGFGLVDKLMRFWARCCAHKQTTCVVVLLW